ncbi:MAG: hypothetical protein A2992_10410 [Elusimicrobia bacterium RIFCSPLOWO2_01_FULL_59_12]|nr:MAG: hypothetical protein A2992_10410 [Elusimicrobia bacterium RIFCSPLOWO2_01_FULL_59_12]
MNSKTDPRIVYRLTGDPLRRKEGDLPPREIDVSHVPLHELQRIFHAGPNNRMLERRHVNEEKASRLQSYCADSIDTKAYRWEFCGRWSDES